MAQAPIGVKIRERRIRIGLTQTELAARLGISTSYLNLIERNKRNIAPRLFKGLAANLQVDQAWLDGEAERRLTQDVRELVSDPILRGFSLDEPSILELVARNPAWAEAMVALYRAYSARNQAVSALSDRLNQDPFLGDAVHTMLTKITSIRSASEILDTVKDLSDTERDRFQSVLATESANLSGIAEGIAQFFDTADTETAAMTPAEEVDDFILHRRNFFAEMEDAADQLRAEIDAFAVPSEAKLVSYLEQRHGIVVRFANEKDIAPEQLWNRVSYSTRSKTFQILEGTPPSTARFQLARLACQLTLRELIAQTTQDSEYLRSDESRERGQGAMASYAAAALLLPYGPFLREAEAARYDIDRLARKYGASFEQVCHRLVTLQKPGEEGIPFAFMRTDPAGFITKRMPLPRLPLPRYGNACPLWAVYNAFQAPGETVRQLAEFPNGERILFVASARAKATPRFNAPRHLVSVMIGCDILYADRTVYADGLDIGARGLAVPVGPSCKLCARRDCAYREEAPLQAQTPIQNPGTTKIA